MKRRQSFRLHSVERKEGGEQRKRENITLTIAEISDINYMKYAS